MTSLKNFTLAQGKAGSRKQLAILKKDASTSVWLYNTCIVQINHVNNVVTLRSGGWFTESTKTAMNRALSLVYGNEVHVFQRKFIWYVAIPGHKDVPFQDGMIIGGGSGAPFMTMGVSEC